MIIKKGNTLDVIKNVYFRRSEPISVVHFLTNRCNARCAFVLLILIIQKPLNPN